MNFFQSDKIAIFSDLHLGLANDSKFWHDVSFEWAKWFISDLNKKNIKDIIFCGDFYHSRSDLSVSTLDFGNNFLKLFKDFNLYMLIGNHDCFLRDSSEVNSVSQYNEWTNIKVYDKPFQCTHNGKTINYIPWGVKLEDIPNADITFGHFEIMDFKMNNYHLCDDGMFSGDLLKKSPFIISGHFHLRDDKDYNNGRILYVGNPFQMDFNDASTVKGYYTLDIETGKTEFTENTISPKHFNVNISDLCSEDGISDRVKHWFNNNLVKLKVDRRVSSDDMEYILSYLKSLNPIDLQVSYQAEVQEYGLQEEKRDLSGIDLKSAIAEFIKGMDIDNKKDVEKYCLEMYDRSIN